MKTTKKIIAKLTFFLTSLFIFNSCYDNKNIGCDILNLADLLIPKVVKHFDNNGNTIFESSNELYYNERTAEYFNNEHPPVYGLQTGDYIQIATNIYNLFSDTECKTGANSPISTTAPKLNISSPSYTGNFSIPGMITPKIPIGGNAFTASRFQLTVPGYYKVDFNANAPRNIKEHNYENNFYFGKNGNYSKREIEENYSFKVSGELLKINNSPYITDKKINDAPKNIEEMKKLEIYQFLNSESYKDWVLKKKQE